MSLKERRPQVNIDPSTAGIQHLVFPERVGVDGKEQAEEVDLVVAFEQKRLLRKRRQMIQVEIVIPEESGAILVVRQELIEEGFRRGKGIAIDPNKLMQGQTEILGDSVGCWVEFKQYKSRAEFAKHIKDWR